MKRWFRTNRFLRDALEEAHSDLGDCAADLELERIHRERLELHLTVAKSQRCPMCDELERDRQMLVDRCDELERERGELLWETERWRAFYYASVPPMDAS